MLFVAWCLSTCLFCLSALQSGLYLFPGSQLDGDLFIVGEEDEEQINTVVVATSIEHRIYDPNKTEKRILYILTFFPRKHQHRDTGREGTFLSLMKKDICQRKTTEATSYYSPVMHECEFVCYMFCNANVPQVLNIQKHRNSCTETNLPQKLSWNRVSVLHTHTYTLYVQLCQQVHIYLVVLWY